MDILKELLIAIGGGATALIALLTIFKSMFMKFFQKGVDTAFDKNLEKYKNTLRRTTSAYEILLNKELNFYTGIETPIANLIVLIQDLAATAQNKFDQDQYSQINTFEKYLYEYTNIIPEFKNVVLTHQSYIPINIFTDASQLINLIQDNLVILKGYLDNLRIDKLSDAQISESAQISQNTLMSIAKLQEGIMARLKDLSEA